jgi:LGFP repeat
MSDPLIDAKWAALGGVAFLGKPVGDYSPAGQMLAHGPKGPTKWEGRWRPYEKGVIYRRNGNTAHPPVHEVHGLILRKWSALGRNNVKVGWLGFPLTDEVDTAAKTGRWNRFENGIIVWKRGAEEAFELHGAIRNKWHELGGSAADIGYPVTDERGTPDGIGRFNHFDRGSIYWTPSLGAHEVHGLIRKQWADGGWERNEALGYPITDELSAARGRFSEFENGVLYWRSGNDHAGELVPWKVGIPNQAPPSQSPQQLQGTVEAGIRRAIAELGSDLPHGVAGVKITSGPRPRHNMLNHIAGRAPWITDYRVGKTRVVNRRLQFTVEFDLEIEMTKDINVELDLDIELYRRGQNLMSRIDRFEVDVVVGFPTILGDANPGVIASQIEAKLKAREPVVEGTFPSELRLLSVKVLPDGSLASFIEPFSA